MHKNVAELKRLRDSNPLDNSIGSSTAIQKNTLYFIVDPILQHIFIFNIQFQKEKKNLFIVFYNGEHVFLYMFVTVSD
jgi:hypothetical protein